MSEFPEKFTFLFFLRTAVYSCGIGETHATNFMAALEIPFLHKKSRTDRQDEVASPIKAIAKESCQKQLELEAKLTVEPKERRWFAYFRVSDSV